ncbi:hypothetical protein F5Y10DRAFT_271137 [Nemania abortiva]|nr:hypothetical protein F5Y10DRAFT_271137 [Nemania abortiva]
MVLKIFAVFGFTSKFIGAEYLVNLSEKSTEYQGPTDVRPSMARPSQKGNVNIRRYLPQSGNEYELVTSRLNISIVDAVYGIEHWLVDNPPRHRSYGNDGLEDDEGLNISFLRVEFDCGGIELKLHAAADESTPAWERRDITGHVLGPHCFTERHISLAIAWLEDCDLNHPACHSTLFDTQIINVENADLPSRCIEVRDLGAMNNECVNSSSRMSIAELWDSRLSETSGQTGKCIILSHRWNEAAEACKTTRSNYSRRFGDIRHEFPDMELSPLFVDVCRMAYKFHIRYVWIDTICIIQDDPNDWKRESTKMADYMCYDNCSPWWLNQQFGSRGFTEDIPSPLSQQRQPAGGIFLRLEWTLSRRILTFYKLGIFLECQSSDPQSVSGDIDRLVAIAGVAREVSHAIDSWRGRTPKPRDNVWTIGRARKYRDAETCDIFEAVTIPVEGSRWRPDFSRPLVNTIPNNEFGNDNRFVVLEILVVVQPVRVNEVFTSLDDAWTARIATDCIGEPRETWRRVSIPSNPSLIAGWAALEAPSYQSIAACQSSLGDIYALYIGNISRH